MFKTTVVFKQNYNSNAHIVINQGGTSSGKTYAIQQVLFCIATQNNKKIITVVGQDIPNLKSGVLRDALEIQNETLQFRRMLKTYNKTDRIFEFKNGSAKHPRPNHQPGEFVIKHVLIF